MNLATALALYCDQEYGPKSGVDALPGHTADHGKGCDCPKCVGFVKARHRKGKKKKKMKAVAGEPAAGGSTTVHYESNLRFHPPSLKNPDRVPTDDPRETDNKFLDVTKRKARDTERFRGRQARRNANPPQLPANTTAVQPHTGVYMPFATTGV